MIPQFNEFNFHFRLRRERREYQESAAAAQDRGTRAARLAMSRPDDHLCYQDVVKILESDTLAFLNECGKARGIDYESDPYFLYGFKSECQRAKALADSDPPKRDETRV